MPLGNGTSIPFYTVDNLHPAPAGAFVIGYLLALARYVPLNESVIGGSADLYSATDNPAGNLVTNPLFTGSSGTLGSAAVTGSVATSWKVSIHGLGVWLAGHVLARNHAHGGFCARHHGANESHDPGSAPGGGGEREFCSNDQVYIAQTVSSNFAAGDVLVAEIEVDVSNIANMTGLGLNINDLPGGGSTSQRHRDLGQYATNRGFHTQSWNGVLRTFPFTVVADAAPGPHTLAFQVTAFFNASAAAASATIKVSNASLRRAATL